MNTKFRKFISFNAWIIIILGFSITLFASFALYRGIEREKLMTFNTQVETVKVQIQNRMSHYEGALVDARAHLKTIDVNRVDLFSKFVRDMRLSKRYPGFLGVGLARAVKRKDLKSFVEETRRFIPGFTVRPESDNDILYPIVDLEPMSSVNRLAVGFDMGTELKRREAMEFAAEKMIPVLSGKINLVQDADKKSSPGFNYYLPVRNDRGDLIGFVYTPFRAEDLFRETLKGMPLSVSVEIFDGKAIADNLLFRSHEKEAADYETHKKLVLGNRELTLRFRNLPSLHADVSYRPIWITIVLGFLTTFILFYLSLSVRRELGLVQRELEATASLRLKDKVIEQSLNGFDIIDDQGKFIYVNPAYVRMWGYDTPEEIIGTSPVGHCLDPEVPRKIIGELKSKGFCDIEFTAKRKDGSTFETRMLSFLAHDSEGREIYPTTSIDISESKEALRARDEFLSLASHELKTPLTSLMLQVQIFEKLQERGTVIDPERTNKFMSIIKSQAGRLNRLVDDMLDVSRIATGRLSLRREEFDLREMVNETLERMQSQFVSAKIPFPAISAEQPIIGRWDRLRLEQALANLLSNAIKYGGKTPVSVEVEMKDGRAVMSVADKGPGIPEKAKEKIFHRYERHSHSPDISGLGLGLFLTKQIVEAHGGQIALESRANEGAKFTIYLPLDSKTDEGISIV